MSQHLQKAIDNLKRKVLCLAALVEENVSRSVKAVDKRDAELANKAIRSDVEIDHVEIDVEEDCLKILALHQPVAVDLRFIVSVLKLNVDLERIGDLAVNIAERAVFLAKQPSLTDFSFDFPRMHEFARQMLRNSLDALIKRDSQLAYKVCASDDELDAMNREMYTIVLRYVEQSPSSITILLHFLLISRALERIGDHATNIAEDVIYMTEARIIRHRTDDFEKDR